jgi:hypothetical protein
LSNLEQLLERSAWRDLNRARGLEMLLASALRHVDDVDSEGMSRRERLRLMFGLDPTLANYSRGELFLRSIGGVTRLQRHPYEDRRVLESREAHWRDGLFADMAAALLLDAAAVPRLPAPLGHTSRGFGLGVLPRPMIGRDAEIAAGVDAASPIVLIAGAPGTGKTVLARTIGQRLLDQFQGRYLEIAAAGITAGFELNAGEIKRAVLDGLGAIIYQTIDSAGLDALYRAELSASPVLVLLDDLNDEEMLRDLLPPTPSRLIVTSHRSFSNAMSCLPITRIDVGPLSREESWRLLAEVLGEPRLLERPEHTRVLIDFADGLPLALQARANRLAKNTRDIVQMPMPTILALPALAAEQTDEGLSVSESIRRARSRLNPADRNLFSVLSCLPVQYFDLDVGEDLEFEFELGNVRALFEANLVSVTPSRRFRLHKLTRASQMELGAESSASLRIRFDGYTTDPYVWDSLFSAEVSREGGVRMMLESWRRAERFQSVVSQERVQRIRADAGETLDNLRNVGRYLELRERQREAVIPLAFSMTVAGLLNEWRDFVEMAAKALEAHDLWERDATTSLRVEGFDPEEFEEYFWEMLRLNTSRFLMWFVRVGEPAALAEMHHELTENLRHRGLGWPLEVNAVRSAISRDGDQLVTLRDLDDVLLDSRRVGGFRGNAVEAVAARIYELEMLSLAQHDRVGTALETLGELHRFARESIAVSPEVANAVSVELPMMRYASMLLVEGRTSESTRVLDWCEQLTLLKPGRELMESLIRDRRREADARTRLLDS